MLFRSARAGAGITVPPGEAEAFVLAAERLATASAERKALGNNALDYAHKTFDIRAIGDRFEAILASARRP